MKNKTNTIMVSNRQKKKRLVTRALVMTLFMALFTQGAMAQTSQVLKMTNGTREVPADGFLFFDSGGPLLFDPAVDPENANEYNWTTWYQHNEEYTLTLTVPEGKGIQIAFSKLLVNNDTLRFYEGNSVSPENLIGEFCNNEYSTSFGTFTVTSHGNMTVQFISDYHWRDEGWEAVITQTSAFVPQAPVAVMDNCDNLVKLIPTCIGTTTNVIEYKIGSGSYAEYTPGAWIDLNSQTFPVTLTVKATVDGTASTEKTYTFSRKIQAPNTPIYTLNTSSNSVTTYFPVKPVGVNDTYYIRWTINTNPNGATENPNLWEQSGHEFQQPNNTPTSVPAGVIDYTNAGFTPTFYVHIATRGTTCPDIFSNVVTIPITELCVPMPTITFATNPSTQEGATTLACAMTGVTIYYTTDGSEPTTSSATYSGTFTVTAGTTVKAIAVKTGFKTSDVASAIFVPGGESGDPQSGTYGSVVLLDDREDHTWSYYSDETSPIKSLNPADVKITYTGYGPNTMTSTNPAATGLTNTDFNANVTSSQVAVNVGSETENQFVYLKTLEKDQSTDNEYPYTMIPNPFQKRPTYTGSKGVDINGDFAQAIIHSEVRDGNGNVVAQSAKGNEIENVTNPDRSIVTTRGENTLLSENFDTWEQYYTAYSATDWYAYNANSNANNWGLYQDADYAHSGSMFMGVQYNATYAANCYLVSAPFIVSADMTELSVSLYERVMDSDYAETFEVFFVKASDVTTTAGVASATHYTAIASASYTNETYAEQNGSVTSSALAGESVRVVVHCTSAANMYYLIIDDITVTETTSSGGTTVWAETTTITPNEEYLIGFEYNGNVYLAVNYAANESNHYYTSESANYIGYTALAAIDGNGYVTGVSGYATDLRYCTWKFSTSTGGTITSGYESGRYLYGYTSSSYYDLYPNTSSQSWTYTSSTGSLYNGYYYADYYSYNSTPHMRVKSSPSATVKLYTKQTLSVPCTVTALAGDHISTAYVAEGTSFSGTNQSINTTTGNYVTFKATAYSGYAFSGWYNGSTLVSTDNPYTCQVTGDLTLTAQAVPTYTVTAAHGTGISTAYVAVGTSFSGTSTSVTVAQGGSATFQATLASDYVFDGWYDQSDNRVSANLTYTATNIQGNFTLTAKGSHTYNIYITAAGGTVTASPNPAQAGQSITLTLTPSGSYQLGALTVTNDATGEEITLSGSGNTRTFTMPASTVTVNATFYDPTQTYRGFYAWRVKSLSSGLEIQRADGTSVPVGGMIDAEEDVKFVTNSEEGNEVEFEALWAQAWVTTSTNTAGLNPNVSYERNFMVLSSNSTTTVPVQVGTPSSSYTSSYNPLNGATNNYYAATQQIYTASELGNTSGTIKSISFYKGSSSYARSRTLDVYVYPIPSSVTTFEYDSEAVSYYLYPSTSLTPSYSGSISIPTASGWWTINLTNSVEYNGIDNLMVHIVDKTGSSTSSNYSFTHYTYYTGTYSAAYSLIQSDPDADAWYTTRANYNPLISLSMEQDPAAAALSTITVPLTVTTYNPDGTGGSSSVSVSSAIVSGADMKFENIKLNAIDIDADGHDLVFGRGVTSANSNGLSASVVKGMGTGSTSALKYTMRIESGVIQSFYPGYSNGTSVGTFSSTYSVRAILGSDYDRANNNDNSKLSISPSTHAGEIYGGNRMHMTNPANKENLTFDWYIKSGKFHDGILGAGEGGDQSVYFGSSEAGGSSNDVKLGYIGKRRATIEGGEFASLAGGMNQYEYGYETYGSVDVKDMVMIRMRGGNVRGAIYGAAAFAGAVGGRTFVITGGNVLGWIAGGCNGTRTTGGELYGDSYIYVGGDAEVGSSGGGNHVGDNVSYEEDDVTYYGVNGANGGIIFGAGCGINPTNSSYQPDGSYTTNTVGRVNNSTVVVSDDAIVWSDVYGGGNFGYVREEGTSTLQILGGTVKGNVYGGANSQQSQTVNLTMKNGTVNGNIYGGSNTWGTNNDGVVVNVSGGTVTNVFGGGYGEDTKMAAGTKVNVSGGTINNNVYGGGEEGTVGTTSTPANTNVSISGGTMKNVYGAGKGDAENGYTADINGQTLVNVGGGTMANVYGGGEAGNVVGRTRGTLASTVTIQGGTINEDVFGGGRLGKTDGDVVVNVLSGNIEGNVYGGAFGRRNEVFIAGTHTVNVTGGNIYANVYGGSRNADDALSFTTSPTDYRAVNHVNISGGHVYYHVFAAGYFGETYGSVYAFIGANAITSAPNAAPTSSVSYNAAALLIDGAVWAGADYGNFDGQSFGASTIRGYSNIYIDGTGYNTVSTKPSDAGYMNIGGSVIGSGTSCYAGGQGSSLIFRNYGQAVENPAFGSKDDDDEPIIEKYTTATRNLQSIQFFKDVVTDNIHVHFIGQGKVNSLLTTDKVTLYEINDVARIANGSSLFVDFPMDQVKKLGSYTCADVYAASPSYVVVNYRDLPTAGKDNKFRVNNGAYLNVKYLDAYGEGKDYGELEGFFYMMTEDVNNTCAYARPKQSTEQGNIIPEEYDNENDGGFLSYYADKNTYDAQGGVANPGVQMPYENHILTTKNGEQYFRIWRYGGKYSNRFGVFNAVAKTTAGYSTADVEISLPASRGDGSYFRIKTINGFPVIDYGDDVITVNAGVYNSTDGVPASNGWMYVNSAGTAFVDGKTATQTNDATNGLTRIDEAPNVNFGLVAIPQGSLSNSGNQNLLICDDASDENGLLASNQWVNYDPTINPSILFRLTYNNNLSNNTTWDPIVIVFEQCTSDGKPKDEITITLAVDISTTIDQSFTTQTYAVMNGRGTTIDTYTAKVVMPGFTPYVNTEGDLSDWTFKSATFTPSSGFTSASWTSGSGYIGSDAKFSMQIKPSANYDNTIGWYQYVNKAKDLNGLDANTHLAYTDGRNPAAFDFILHYDGEQTVTDKVKIGDLVVTLHFTNYKYSNEPDHGKDITITVEVWRRGQGNNYYIDGVNGDNFYAGDRPDAAKKTLSGIYNRTDYAPGDNIFIVNTVTANSGSALDWNGELYGGVILYRYPGGHPLKKDAEGVSSEDYYVGYSEAVGETAAYNPNNLGFTGTLIKVEKSMNIHNIILDGAYNLKNRVAALVPDETKYQVPTAPMIDIEANGVLNVYADSKLQWNYTNSNGGAVYNAGKMIIRGGSDIYHNAVLANTYKGAGVYVKDGATLIVSDSITIHNNHLTYNDGSKAVVEKNSNVYLESASSVIQVGTSQQNDGILALENHLNDEVGEGETRLKSAKIGVTKGAWGSYYYTPIAYSDGGGSAYLGNLIPENPDAVEAVDYLIYDDDEYYKVVTLNNTPPYEPTSDYLFWVGTWVTAVHEQPSTYNGTTDPVVIKNAEELAWAISVVNGLNEQTAAPSTNFVVANDIDMDANIWVPMGTSIHPYTGTFNANGHVINGVHSPLNNEEMGMFGYMNGSLENMIVNVEFVGGNSVIMGSVAAIMDGGTGSISNVEAAGTLAGTASTTAMGGLVGKVESGLIHSSFAVNSMTATNADTYMGGLVGLNAGNLINSYANTTMSGSTRTGGLVGENGEGCLVENCYAVVHGQSFPAFAYLNKGTIKYCYADNANGYISDNENGTLQKHGTYAAPYMPHTYGYMYDDNKVTLEGENATSEYVVDAINYAGNKISTWPGLLSSLNQWVEATNEATGGDIVYTQWFRPTTQYINGDLPVLGFPMDNSMATAANDGKYLRYGAFDADTYSMYTSGLGSSTGSGSVSGSDSGSGSSNSVSAGLGNQGFGQTPQDSGSSTGDSGSGNGLDDLLDEYENLAGYIFVYDNAIDVEKVPGKDVLVFINEDVVLKQATGAGEFINATVGVSFDNSHGQATDFFGNTLAYDWHMLSTPLADAPLGITYSDASNQNWWETNDTGQVTGVENSYMPNGTANVANWDLYSFYEPEYHWINLKRNSSSHYHYDEDASGVHNQIEYTNEDTFVAGKGYMVAIDKDSYLLNNGTLNGPSNPVSVTLTKKSHDPGTDELGYNLIGNPYQAYLDVNRFLGANGLSSYWVYIAESDNYIAGNASASENPVLPSATLHPHQGFFVLANSHGQVVNFDYDEMALTTPEANSFFRGGKVNYPLVNLFATGENGKKDLAVIEFNRPEFGGSKKMRAINNANFELSAHMGNQRYSILFTEEGIDRVPVHFVTREEGTFTLTWETYHGTFTSLFLVDNKTGIRTDMLRSEGYTFEGSPDDYASRFYITFKCIGVDEYTDSEGDFAWFDGNDWIVTGQGQLQLVDVLGHVLRTQQLSGDQTRLHLDGYAVGVYMLRLTDGTKSKVQKIIIK